jgi:hypothetical protein
VGGGETVAHTREALTQEFTLPIPVGYSPENIVIGATLGVFINDRAQILYAPPLRSIWGNAWADVAAFGPTTTTSRFGSNTIVGAIWSRTRLQVHGGLLEFYKTENSAPEVQQGTIVLQQEENRQGVMIRMDPMWRVSITAPESGAGCNGNPTTCIVNAGQTVTLPAGNYGPVTVNSQGTLRLTGSGTYGFVALIVNSGATVELTAAAPPRLFVRNDFIIRSPVRRRGLIIGYLGTNSAQIEAPFDWGFLLAPNAQAQVKANGVGRFFARSVAVYEDMSVRALPLTEEERAFVRPTSLIQNRGLFSLTGAAEIGSALLQAGNGCGAPRAFVSYSGGSLFHRPVSSIGTTTNDVVLVSPFTAPTPAPASCIGTALPGYDHNPADGSDIDPPLWPIQAGGRPFYADFAVGADSLTTRLSDGRVVSVGFSNRFCEDPNNGLPQGANCPGVAPTAGNACDAVTNPAACLYGATQCSCVPSCWTAPSPCSSNNQCCSGTCSGGACTAPANAPGTWACGPLTRVEAGILGVRMTAVCGSSWTAGAFDATALGIPVIGGGSARVMDRPELFADSFENKLYLSANTFAGPGIFTGAQQVVYSASAASITNASNLTWQPVRPAEPRDHAGPEVMSTVLDERARLNTTPATFGRYVHLATARCVGTRPILDIQTPFGRKQWDLAEGDPDPATACAFVRQGISGQPFPGIQFGPSIVGVSSTPPRVLVAYTGNSDTTPQYTVINVYSATIRSASGYSLRPDIRLELRVHQGAHSVWPQLIAPDGFGSSSRLLDMPVVLRWSSVSAPNVTEMAQVLYSGVPGPVQSMVFWSIPETFPNIDCPNAGLACFVGDYKYGAFYEKVGGSLSYFTPWTGGARDPETGGTVTLPGARASGGFVDVVP